MQKKLHIIAMKMECDDENQFLTKQNTRDSLNSLNDDSAVFDSNQKLSIPKQNTLPVKGRFGGGVSLILTDGEDDDEDHHHHPNGRIRRRWRNIERGIHKRVEDFRDH